MNIAGNILRLKGIIPGHVGMIAVSKMQPVSALMEAYEAGQRIFGENKAMEMASKRLQLPSDIEWHFIGHLQTNKVKYLASFVSLIHSIDSVNLLKEINREAMKHNRIIDCLLQFHIATEETKFGLSLAEAKEIMESGTYLALKYIRITGVMGMSSFTDDQELVRREFKALHESFIRLKELYFKDEDSFKVISMGMSGDYMIAIDEGSTMVRIGTAIFGERHY